MSAQSRSGGGGGMHTVGYAGEQLVAAGPPDCSVCTVVSAAVLSSSRLGSPSGVAPHDARMQPSTRTSARVENVPSWSSPTWKVAVTEPSALIAANEQVPTQDFVVQLPSCEPAAISWAPPPGRRSRTTWSAASGPAFVTVAVNAIGSPT